MSSSNVRSPAIPKPAPFSRTASDPSTNTSSTAPNTYFLNGLYSSVDAQLIDEIMLRSGSVQSQTQYKQSNPTTAQHHHQQSTTTGHSNNTKILVANPAAISALSTSTKSLNINPFGPTSLHFPAVEHHIHHKTVNRNTLTKSSSSNNLRHESLLLGATNYHRPLITNADGGGGNSLPSFYNSYLPANTLRQQQSVATASRNSLVATNFSTPTSLKHVPVPALSHQANHLPTNSTATGSASLLNLSNHRTNTAIHLGPSSGNQMSSSEVVLVQQQQPIPPPPITTSNNSNSAASAAAAAAASASTRSSLFPRSITMIPNPATGPTRDTDRSPHEPPLPPTACHRSVVMSSEFKRSNGEKFNTQVATPMRVMELYASKLTPFEHDEIFKYPQIYFIGANAKKRPGIIGSANNSDYDNEHGSYIHIQNDHVAYRYEVLMIIGKGSFGQVVKAYDHKTHEHVALKMVRNEKRFYRQAHEEIRILEHLRKQDKDNTMNIIHMYRSFEFRNHVCITFEILYINLYELIRRNKFYGFSLQLVRKFAHALLQCLDALAKNKIIHCDMKPENVMLKQQGRSGIKVSFFLVMGKSY